MASGRVSTNVTAGPSPYLGRPGNFDAYPSHRSGRSPYNMMGATTAGSGYMHAPPRDYTWAFGRQVIYADGVDTVTNQTVSPPAATGTATAPTASLDVSVPPGAATASASSPSPLVIERWNTLDGGSNGTVITTGNSGGTSGDAFDTVSGSPTFSSAQAHSGTLSMAPVSATSNELRWTDAGALGGNHFTTLFLRTYLYLQASPSGNTVVMGGRDDASLSIWRVAVSTTGKLVININGTATVTSTTSITQNAWVRLEAQISVSGGTAATTARLFNSPEATTPDETISTSASVTSNYVGTASFGPTSVSFASPPWYDDLAFSSVTWVGPSPSVGTTVNPPTATASASALVPAIQLGVAPSAATASASSPAPTIQVQVLPAAATANASAPAPTVQLKVSPAAATATASALVPVPKLEVDPPAATASASAPVPQVLSGQTVSPPAATASASALVPTLQVQVTPGVATATASALVPTVQLKISPAAATAATSALVAVPQLTALPGAASASASALAPSVIGGQTVAPPTGTASASAPVPTIIVPVPQVVSPPPGAASALARVPIVTGSAVIVNSWAIGGAWSSSWGFKPNAPDPSAPLDIHVPPQPAEPLR